MASEQVGRREIELGVVGTVISVIEARWPARARWLLPVLLGAALAWVVTSRMSPRGGPVAAGWSGTTMGTTYTVQLGTRSHVEDAALRASVERELDRINRLMSTYDSRSELSRFNRYTGSDPFALSPSTLTVLIAARDISERSGGVFDPTVAPLVNAWGFGPDGPTAVPSDMELAALRKRVDFRSIVIEPGAGTAIKRRPDVTLDLSAIAKGYGVDRVAAVLEDAGIRDYLVEVGGEVKGRGTKGDGTSWRVGIEAPTPGVRSIFDALPLADIAVATSGDYRNFYERNDTTWSHIIDPRTGRPIAFIGRTVSVFHPEAMVADAWATALTVLDVDAGLRLAEREGVAALMVITTDDGFTARSTPAFAAYRRRVESAEGAVR